MKLAELVPELPATQELTKKQLKKQRKREMLERIGQLKASAAATMLARQQHEKEHQFYAECNCGLMHLFPVGIGHDPVSKPIPATEYQLKNWENPIPSREETTLRRASTMPRQLCNLRNTINMYVSLK